MIDSPECWPQVYHCIDSMQIGANILTPSHLALSLLVIMTVLDRVAADERQMAIESSVVVIDRLLQEHWDREQITAAPNCDDPEFCRRVWLDLAGVAPPVAEVRQFLMNSSTDKRSRLIDRLLRSPRHASHMASRWTDILLPSAAAAQPGTRANVASLHRWLQRQFLDNTPYDYFVSSFLTAGGAGNSGPAIFYTSHSLQPEKLAAATSRIFMGIQLQCAECHDHPFDRWTQEDFWHYAAFFSQLRQSNAGRGGTTIIDDFPGGEVRLPGSSQVMAPRYPGISEPPEKDPADHRRRQLTIWMASRDNPFLAHAAVNRAWDHLFGRGLVDPVDAMDAGNRSLHPELLDHLAQYLIQQRFDMRDLYAAIARSAAYSQTSSIPEALRPPQDSFAAMNVKTLTASQFYDSMRQNVYRRSALLATDPASPERALRDQFLSRMKAVDTSPRDYPNGVVQVLGLMNGPEVAGATDENSSALLAAIEAPFFDDVQRIEILFLATLSRQPSEKEMNSFGTHLSAAETSQQRGEALSDLLWILLNTAECAVCP